MTYKIVYIKGRQVISIGVRKIKMTNKRDPEKEKNLLSE